LSNSGRHFIRDPFWIPSHRVRTTFEEAYLHNQKEECDVVVRLKIVNIDRDRMPIRVVQSKGKKERYAKLSVKFLVMVNESKRFSKALLISKSGYYTPSENNRNRTY
jgi:hypothetical protein